MENVFIYDQATYDKESIKREILDSGVLNIIKNTDKVVVKPNFVQESRNQDEDWDYVITHPVLISAVFELLADIIGSQGKIILVDAPMTGSSFEKILSHMPVDIWRELFQKKNITFEVIDLREEEWKLASNGIILNRKALSGDPMGKVLTNLKNDCSEFFSKPKTSQILYGADYDTKETNNAHNGTDNIYSVSATVIDADVFINLPKLKTHKKAGITCCLKNLVGINTNKNLLPHHTVGTPKEGGDQFESSSSGTVLESGITMIAKHIIVRFKFLSPLLVPLKKLAIAVWGDNKTKPRSGGWYGNDTLWRTILDLNKVLFYSNRDGSLKENCAEVKKRYIGIVDAIYAGQGNGPLEPELLQANYLICGTNPVAIDAVAAKLMHFDYKKIPQIKHAFEVEKYRLIESDYFSVCCIKDGNALPIENFHCPDKQWMPPLGWKGHIEEE